MSLFNNSMCQNEIHSMHIYDTENAASISTQMKKVI